MPIRSGVFSCGSGRGKGEKLQVTWMISNLAIDILAAGCNGGPLPMNYIFLKTKNVSEGPEKFGLGDRPIALRTPLLRKC